MGMGALCPKLDDSFYDTNRWFVWRIQELEVKEALRKMKGGRPLAPMMSTLRCGDAFGDMATWLTIIQPYFGSNKMPEERRKVC